MTTNGGRWWRARGLAVAVLVVLLSACAGGSDPATVPGSATGAGGATSGASGGSAGAGGLGALASAVESAAGSAVSGAATGSAGAPASPAATSAGPAAAGATRTVTGTDYFQFMTPSKNIGCAISTEQVRCDIVTKTWTVAAPASGCELDYGNGLSLADGPAQITCAGDTVLGGSTTIAYDHSVAAGDFACLVNKAGVTCRNTATGHGFTLSREAHTEF